MPTKKKAAPRKGPLNAEEIRDIATGLTQLVAAGFLKLVSDVMSVVDKNAAAKLEVDKAMLDLRKEEVEILRDNSHYMKILADAAIFWQDHRNDVGGGSTS